MPTLPPGPVTSIQDLALSNKLRPQPQTDRRWFRNSVISGGNWNKLFPYELLVVEQSSDGSYATKTDSQGEIKFTLPIPPETIGLSMPFAVSADATLGGVVERHSGAPFRMISLSGTTGVLIGKTEAPAVAPTASLSEAIFAGTITQANQTASAFGTLQNGSQTFETNAIADSEFDDTDGMGALTGWYQFRLLQAFFEDYLALKQTKAGQRSVLALACYKDEAVYLVTPQAFDVRKSASNPLEYMYQLNLKAWKRIKLSGGTVEIINTYVPIQRDPNKLAQLLTSIQDSRRVLQGARKTILAVSGDVQHSLFEPMREVCLFAKDALSVPLAIADLADSVIKSTKDAIVTLKGTRKDIFNFPQNAAQRTQQITVEARDAELAIGALAAEKGDDPSTQNSREAHPANTPFVNPSENYDFFSTIQVGDLQLPPPVMAQIAADRARVRRLTRLDFKQRRDTVLATANQFANAIGLGDPTFNKVYGLTAPATPAVEEPTDEDFDIVYALNQVVQELNRLVVSNDNDPNAILDSVTAIAGMATRSGIAFQIPKSKYPVPFPYGSTLEMLSARYLGTPDRWHEIAALNGLRSPYVDEEGFVLPLLTSGARNQIMVSDTSNLHVGKPVWIESNATMRERRTIIKIDKITSTSFILTVDGNADLEKYSVLAEAKLTAFLPDTVNSQQTIYIPSDTEPKEGDFKTQAIPGLDEFDSLIAVGGVDFLLTQSNDLVLTPDAEPRWSVGLTNVIQQIRLAVSTVQGSVLRHPEFGLPLEPGQSIADLSPSQVIRATQTLFAGNPTFTGVKNATLAVTGPTSTLALNVAVSGGGNQVIPVGVEIKS